MATTTQTVIIDFQADFTSVEDAVNILERTGKVDADLAAKFRATNAEINKQGQAFAKTATTAGQSTQSFSKLSQLMQQFPKSGMNRFLLQVGNELSAAGFKAKDFYQKLDPKDAVTKQTTLRNELRQVREQMQAAALAGGVLGEEYKRLKQRAGELDDTIRDVSNDIKNAGSDTRGIDNVVGSISALAGGYSAVQGAVALFGEENEDLQKALLKVNAAMALATGLQQVSNALTKQGSIIRLADAVATGYQSAAQTIYTAVTGRATAATVAFRVALAATGIGLVIVGIIALSSALKRSNRDMEDATSAIERYSKELEGLNTLLDQNLSIDLARAEKAGKAESDLIAIRGKSLLKQREAVVQNNRDLVSQRDALDGTSAAYGKLNNAIEENNGKLKELDSQLVTLSINREKAQADERKTASDKALEKAKEAAEKAREAAKKERAAELEDLKAGIEDKLVFVQQGSEEELELRKKLLGAELEITMNNDEITKNQRLLAVSEYFKAYEDLQKEFGKKATAAAIEDQRNRDAAILENLNLSEEERLEVRIEFLQLGAAQEITLAEGNAAKIKAINAKLQADITASKVASIKAQADYEIALSSAQGGVGKRALDAVAGNEKLKSDIRINAIRQAADIEISYIDRSIKANRNAAAIQGADQRTLALEYAQLLDAKAAKTEETEKKITDLTKAEQDIRRANDVAYIQTTLAGLNDIASIIGAAQANSQELSDQAIEAKKREVQELLEAGAITEREALQRNKRIEAEERKAKQRAAQQQKNLAVFQAFLAIPQAFIAGLTAPFPVGGPIYGAILAGLAAAQAAVVASRPVPKFATGKKGSYSGLAEVGEVGAELIQRADGSMEVATRRQMVYLGSRDKVFTAGETKNMMPFVNKEAIAASGKGFEFDYNRMARAMQQKNEGGVNINIDKDGITEWTKNGLSRMTYHDKYYSSK
jgi:hypothetical protein